MHPAALRAVIVRFVAHEVPLLEPLHGLFCRRLGLASLSPRFLECGLERDERERRVGRFGHGVTAGLLLVRERRRWVARRRDRRDERRSVLERLLDLAGDFF
jgi:hypothetical protein